MRSEVLKIAEEFIYPVIDEFAETLPSPSSLSKIPSTIIFGISGALDSIAFISFLIEIETRIKEKTHKSIRLFNDKALNHQTSPFRTVEMLAEYINGLLDAEYRDG